MTCMSFGKPGKLRRKSVWKAPLSFVSEAQHILTPFGVLSIWHSPLAMVRIDTQVSMCLLGSSLSGKLLYGSPYSKKANAKDSHFQKVFSVPFGVMGSNFGSQAMAFLGMMQYFFFVGSSRAAC